MRFQNGFAYRRKIDTQEAYRASVNEASHRDMASVSERGNLQRQRYTCASGVWQLIEGVFVARDCLAWDICPGWRWIECLSRGSVVRNFQSTSPL